MANKSIIMLMILLGMLAPLALTVIPSSTLAQASFPPLQEFTSTTCVYSTEPYYSQPSCTTMTGGYSQVTSGYSQITSHSQYYPCSFTGSISQSVIVQGTQSVTASGFDSCGPTVNVELEEGPCGINAGTVSWVPTTTNNNFFSEVVPTYALTPGRYCIWMASPCTTQGCVAPTDVFDPLTVEQPVCDLTATKSVTPSSLTIGQTATVTVTVTNAGSQACQSSGGVGWEVLDNLPAGLNMSNVMVAYPPSGWQCADYNKPVGDEVPGFACFSNMALPPSYPATFTFQVVAVGPAGSYNNCAYAYQGVRDVIYTNPNSNYKSTNACALFTVTPSSVTSASTSQSYVSSTASSSVTAPPQPPQPSQPSPSSSRSSEIEIAVAIVAALAVGSAAVYKSRFSGDAPLGTGDAPLGTGDMRAPLGTGDSPVRSVRSQSKAGGHKSPFCVGCGGRLPRHYPGCPANKA